jgi:hypothetical protein
MSPIVTTVEKNKLNYENSSEKDAINALYKELEKGILSVKNSEVYTIDEAWKEIDKI